MKTDEQLNLEHLLTEVYERGASDLLLSVGNPPMMRMDGRLRSVDGEIVTPEMTNAVMRLLLSDQQIELFTATQHLTCGVTYRGDARFRLHAYLQEGYPALNLRFIPKQVPSLSSLGFSASTIQALRSARGLVILASREGNGKTTTWASLLEQINQERAEHMILLQDPIEHLLIDKQSIVDQREVGRDVKDFATGIQDAAHESVTILGVDGMTSDLWSLCLGRAVAGQTVIVTSAHRSVAEILDHVQAVFGQDGAAQRSDLSRVLSMVLVQALVPRRSTGQELVHEILIMNNAIRQLVANGDISQIQSVIETSRAEGMIGFDQHLSLLIREGRLDAADAKAFVVLPESFQALLEHGQV